MGEGKDLVLLRLECLLYVVQIRRCPEGSSDLVYVSTVRLEAGGMSNHDWAEK